MLHLNNVGGEELRAELNQGSRIGLPTAGISCLFGDRVLNVYLNNADAMRPILLHVTEDVSAVCLSAGDRKEEGRWKTVGLSELGEQDIEAGRLQALELDKELGLRWSGHEGSYRRWRRVPVPFVGRGRV